MITITHQPSSHLKALQLTGLLALATLISACEDQTNPPNETEMMVRTPSLCEQITCSGHGVCIELAEGPTCACDEGYQADPVNGLGCLLWSPPGSGMGGGTDESIEAGEVNAGESRAGEEPAGESMSGEMSSGEVMAGEMIAGDLMAGETAAGEVMAGELIAGEAAAGEMAAGETTAGEMIAGEQVEIDESCSEAPEDVCVDDLEDENAAGLCDGLDNDCDGTIDEGCGCKPGEVRNCFSGPPNRLNIGACAPGTMRCLESGQLGVWGPCEGEVAPQDELCDGLDNDCDTCLDEIEACEPEITCPGPEDPRIPDAVPFTPYTLDGALFYGGGDAAQWSWTVTGGPCDAVSFGQLSFSLSGADSERATFTPILSGSYRVTLVVISTSGERFECSWVIHVRAPGLRVEMCYPESTYLDLDLFLMRHSQQSVWFLDVFDPFNPSPFACSWANCEALIRGFGYSRVNWGYAPSPIDACVNTPQGLQWSSYVGQCANPRLDIDNNLEEGIGVPENINIDQPVNGETYRVMVHNFSGGLARPIVNIYCGGELKATLGAAPNQVPNFQGSSIFSIGAMWRALDVTTWVDESGETTDCAIDPLHPPGLEFGFDVTQDNPRF